MCARQAPTVVSGSTSDSSYQDFYCESTSWSYSPSVLKSTVVKFPLTLLFFSHLTRSVLGANFAGVVYKGGQNFYYYVGHV